MKPRCIAFVERVRCRHAASKRMGDLFVCTRHGRITIALIDDRLSPASRRALALARWETAVEGQRVIGRLQRRVA